jgi:hypothetical protein
MKENKPEIKLKPVVFTNSSFERGAPQVARQIILLKAMQVTSDPNELRKMIGVRTVADVYRTLDKMAMRKEYHEALAGAGISFDYIVGGLKDIADSGEKDSDRLKAFQTLLKSLGLDKYDASDSPGGGTWEEELLKAIGKDDEQKKGLPSPEDKDELPEYTVEAPEMPDSIKRLRKAESDLTDSLYG